METMRVMSLDQKSRFLMLGPCSSGGTAFDWTGRENKNSQISILKNLSVTDYRRAEILLESVYIQRICVSEDLQDLSDILCCTDHDSCWKCIRRWSWGRLLRNPSPPDLPLGGSVVPGPEHNRFKLFYLIPSKIYEIQRLCQQASFLQTYKMAQLTPLYGTKTPHSHTQWCSEERSFSLDRLMLRIYLRLHSRKYWKFVLH